MVCQKLNPPTFKRNNKTFKRNDKIKKAKITHSASADDDLSPSFHYRQ